MLMCGVEDNGVSDRHTQNAKERIDTSVLEQTAFRLLGHIPAVRSLMLLFLFHQLSILHRQWKTAFGIYFLCVVLTSNLQ